MPRTLLVFQLAGQVCALPAGAVQEIVPMASLARPPGLPSLLEGFLNLRGAAVPVLRLHRLFHLPAAPPGLYTPVVILRGPAHPLALLVDQVRAVVNVTAEAFSAIERQHCFNDCAEAEVALDGDAAHLLRPDHLLLEKERQCLAELQAIAQQYLDELEARQR